MQATFPEPESAESPHQGQQKRARHMEGHMFADVLIPSFIYSDGGLVIPVPSAHSPQPRQRGREQGAQNRIQKDDLLPKLS